MAAVVVQSRFACLHIEDDDFQTSSETQKVKKNKTSVVKKPDQVKKSEPLKKPAKTAKSQAVTQHKKKKPKANEATAEQWEMWKQKDEELVDGNFESELQQAILLSKLDYEEKKDVYKKFKKEAQVEKRLSEQSAKSGNKKQKKKNVMSLDQFNDMVSGEEHRCVNHEDEKDTDSAVKPPGKDTEFFERIKDETKNEIMKNKIIDQVRNRPQVTDEVITRLQFAEVLEKKDKKIASLMQEITELKEELLTVKTRNRKLCNILGQGEMKDKAEVLVELERLKGVQAELTAEVSTLHTELERERSKNPDNRTKDKKKKLGHGEKEK